MHFVYPWMLLLLALPIAFVIWQWRHRGTPVVMPFDHVGVVPLDRLQWWVNVAGVLPPLAVAAGILLLARPQRILFGQTEKEVRNIQFLVDISLSMQEPYGGAKWGDNGGTKFDAAVKAVTEFANHRKGDAYAFSVYSTQVFDWLPLTKDPSAIGLAVPFLRPGAARYPKYLWGTLICGALEKTIAHLAGHSGDCALILVTDGQSDDLTAQSVPRVIQELRDAHITVYSIFIGSDESSVEIGTIARETGGAIFRPGDPNALEAAFRKIDAMQPTRVKPVDNDYVDWPVPAAVLGLGALLLHAACAFGLRYTPW